MNIGKVKQIFLWFTVSMFLFFSILISILIMFVGFNNIAQKALTTVLTTSVHMIIFFGFMIKREKDSYFSKFYLFLNTTFFLIIISMIVSVFSVWGLLDSFFVEKFYKFFIIVSINSLYIDVLLKLLGRNFLINTIIYINIFSSLILNILLQIYVFHSNYNNDLPELFFRFLASISIINFALTTSAIFIYKTFALSHKTKDEDFEFDSLVEHYFKLQNFFWIFIYIFLLIGFLNSILN